MERLGKLESVCAIAIVVAFFLPWAQLFGFSASGYGVTKLGSYANLLWLIPAAGLLALVLNLQASPHRTTGGVIAGLMPWLALVFAVADVGNNLFHLLSIGAYVTLAASLTLLAKSALPSAEPTAPSSLPRSPEIPSGNCPECAEPLTPGIPVGTPVTCLTCGAKFSAPGSAT